MIVAVSCAGEVEGEGTKVLVDHATLNGLLGLGSKVAGYAIVTLRPVESTVTVTVESLGTAVKVVPVGKADPAGRMLPCHT